MTKKEVQAKVKDLRSQGYYSDSLMLFENFSATVDAVHNSACYLPRCDGFAPLVLEIQGVELAHRYAKIFRAYHAVVAKRYPHLMESGLTQVSQFRLHQQLCAHLSSTVSYEMVYKAILVGDGRHVLRPNSAFQVVYQNGIRAGEPTPKTLKWIDNSLGSRKIQNL